MEMNTISMISLNGNNYQVWRWKMLDILYCKNFHPLLADKAKPNDKTDDQYNAFHRQVCSYIGQWIDDSVYSHISDESNAGKLWKMLKNLYAKKASMNKLYLYQKLISLKYKDGTPMAIIWMKWRALWISWVLWISLLMISCRPWHCWVLCQIVGRLSKFL